jgi:hypothetical protein
MNNKIKGIFLDISERLEMYIDDNGETIELYCFLKEVFEGFDSIKEEEEDDDHIAFHNEYERDQLVNQQRAEL